jgi:hypothetical protein
LKLGIDEGLANFYKSTGDEEVEFKLALEDYP